MFLSLNGLIRAFVELVTSIVKSAPLTSPERCVHAPRQLFIKNNKSILISVAKSEPALASSPQIRPTPD